MFDWFKRKRPAPPLLPPPPPHVDDVLGTLGWNPEDDAWVATVRTGSHEFRILIGGDEQPDERLLAHAREIFIAPATFTDRVNDLLRRQAHEMLDWTEEVLSLRVGDVALLWPDDPDGGIVYLDGPDTGERRWQCDFKDGQPEGPLSYDD